MRCDICGNLANSLWASADVAGTPTRVCSPCVEEGLDVKFSKEAKK